MNTSAPARWFRMYAEFATDPKVQMLSEADQRRYVMLLCIRCSNGDVTVTDEEAAFQLRVSAEDWAETKARLAAKGLLNGGNLPTAWEKRQYASDSSSQRVRKHREAKRRCNGDVTPPETETETETEKTKPIVGSPNGEPDATASPKTSPDALAVLAAAKEHGLPWRKPHKFLLGRISEGATVDDCAAVIAFKCAEWRGTDREQYLRQETLFRPGKFEGYLLGARKWQEKERTLVRVFGREEATQNWQETRCGHEGPDGRRCLRDKGHTDLWRAAGKRHADSNGFWED